MRNLQVSEEGADDMVIMKEASTVEASVMKLATPEGGKREGGSVHKGSIIIGKNNEGVVHGQEKIINNHVTVSNDEKEGEHVGLKERNVLKDIINISNEEDGNKENIQPGGGRTALKMWKRIARSQGTREGGMDEKQYPIKRKADEYDGNIISGDGSDGMKKERKLATVKNSNGEVSNEFSTFDYYQDDESLTIHDRTSEEEEINLLDAHGLMEEVNVDELPNPMNASHTDQFIDDDEETDHNEFLDSDEELFDSDSSSDS
ncbi:uncharacterized protein G2W53_039448 [Senna tora]|uniref:Uncharacterized protein n=1 Tax=Senna tora TaxID=362788 RepID=A0A834STC7_9FABA|nr:uncharacterized protein G2W53_039448 [Senna tora]